MAQLDLQPLNQSAIKLDLQPMDPAQPGVDSIGTTNGQTPAGQQEESTSLLHKLTKYGGKALHSTANVLDTLRGGITAPLAGLAMEQATGKPAFSGQEYADAITPFSGKAFPGVGEMAKRVGMPEGAKLSDYLDMYAKPGSDHSWYQPETGGMLDPTLRGTGGFAADVAIDPLTYLSLGSAGLGKKALAEGASRMAIENAAKESAGPVAKILAGGKGLADKAIDTITTPAQALAAKVGEALPGKIANNVATAPSQLVDWVGKKAYNSTVLPAIQEGEKFGKADVGDTLYNLGIANPLKIVEKAKDATGRLMDARNKILDAAGAQGATVPMADATAQARAAVAKLRGVKDSDAHAIADQLEAKLNEYENIEKGSPGTPDQVTPATPDLVQQQATGILDASGNPVSKPIVMPGKPAVTIPGKPAVPGQPFSPQDATRLKTFIYNNLPNNAWNELAKSTQTSGIRQDLASGLKTSTEDAVSKTLGPDVAQTLADTNAEAGKLLSTQRSMKRVQSQADRLAHGSVIPTGTTKIAGIIGGLPAMAADMAGNAARLGTMPAGYGLRKLSEGQLTAPLIDSYLRQKMIQKMANQPGGQNGQ